jgi:hypothetical protein
MPAVNENIVFREEKKGTSAMIRSIASDKKVFPCTRRFGYPLAA